MVAGLEFPSLWGHHEVPQSTLAATKVPKLKRITASRTVSLVLVYLHDIQLCICWEKSLLVLLVLFSAGHFGSFTFRCILIQFLPVAVVIDIFFALRLGDISDSGALF